MQASRLLSRTKDTATSGIDLYRLPMCQTQRHRQRLDRLLGKVACSLTPTSALDVVLRLSFVLLTATVALVGCAPSDIQVLPILTGNLYTGNAPVAGAEVYLLRGFPLRDLGDQPAVAACGYGGLSAVTSAEGFFWLSSPYARVWGAPKGRDQGGWMVCVRYKHEWVFGYAEEHFGPNSERVRLKCDLAARPADAPATHGANTGICHREV
jgi:hypothetical protein